LKQSNFLIKIIHASAVEPQDLSTGTGSYFSGLVLLS